MSERRGKPREGKPAQTGAGRNPAPRGAQRNAAQPNPRANEAERRRRDDRDMDRDELDDER